jgi:hypothetical protein
VVPSIIALGKAICVFPLLVLAGHFRPTDLALPSFIEAPVWEQYMRCLPARPSLDVACLRNLTMSSCITYATHAGLDASISTSR